MKLKCIPEDFVVEERINTPIQASGDFAIYKVKKINLTTDSLVNQLGQWINKPIKSFSFAGMKDRHGITTQHISLKGDGPDQIETDQFSAQRIGYADQPITPNQMNGNYFKITLRELTIPQIENIHKQQMSATNYGIPNYYDDQRFRSQYSPKNSLAFHLFRTEYESVLKYYGSEFLAKSKKIDEFTIGLLNQHWGDWDLLEKTKIPQDFNSAFNYLKKNPNDFQGAVLKLNRLDLRMMISAGYSFLWNEILIRVMRQKVKSKIIYKKGAWQDYAFFYKLDLQTKTYLDRLKFSIPIKNNSCELENFNLNMNEFLKEHNLHSEQLRSPFLSRFHKGEFSRQALMYPEDFKINEPIIDDLYPGKCKMCVRLVLPPGSYATMVIKRLTLK